VSHNISSICTYPVLVQVSDHTLQFLLVIEQFEVLIGMSRLDGLAEAQNRLKHLAGLGQRDFVHSVETGSADVEHVAEHLRVVGPAVSF